MKGGAQKDMAKVQTCVLRVSIHCEGCKHKVKKLLQKVKGVEKVSVDSEQGKVTVFGDVDPQILVSKLEKSGKNAELLGPHGKAPPPFNFKAQKNGKDSLLIKPGIQAHHLNAEEGPKNLNCFGQKDDKKSVKFKLPEEDFDGDDFGSDEEDDFGSESSDYGAASPPPHPKKPTKSASAHHFDHSSKKGITKKKGGSGSIDKLIKAMLGKSIGKGDSDKKGEDTKKKKKKKNSDAKMGKGKKGPSAIEIDAIKGGKIKIPTSSDIAKIKKKGSNFNGFGQDHGIPKNLDFQPGNSQGMMMPSYGSKGGPPPPPHNQFQGFDMGGNNNPYSSNPQYAQQQQQMMMMMMNQQRMNQNNGYGGHPPPHHPMMMGGYGGLPPQQTLAPADDRYTHMFNDENTGSCSVM